MYSSYYWKLEKYLWERIFFNLFCASSFLGYFCLLNPMQGLESLHHWHQLHFNFVSGISGIWIAVYFLYISRYSQHYIGIHWWCSLSLSEYTSFSSSVLHFSQYWFSSQRGAIYSSSYIINKRWFLCRKILVDLWLSKWTRVVHQRCQFSVHSN